MRKKNKTLTTNEYVNVQDIKNNILYTKDGYIFKYLKIEAINIGTKSEEEINDLIKSLASTFSIQKENEPIIFFKINKSIDIGELINDYSNIYKQTNNLQRRELLRNASSYLHKYATSNIETQNEYYMMIFIKYKNNEDELEKKAKNYNAKLHNIKIRSDILTTEEIIRLCSMFVNPLISNNENMDLEEGISILEGGLYEK